MIKFMGLVFICSIITTLPLYGQNVDEIVERIYQQTLVHEKKLDSLKNYSHVQKVHFIKMDGDGEIEEQSKREYLVKVFSRDQRERNLISAFDYEDQNWIDVTTKEKDKEPRERESAKFSLTEMVSPSARGEYTFSLSGDEIVNSIQTLHLTVKPIEEDEEKFSGDLWFERDSYHLVQARLMPSDNPTGVERMIMDFEMKEHNGVWLPVKVMFEAEVSFLIIFKGKIFSEIRFEEYRFDE
jgi:hypothetical protein